MNPREQAMTAPNVLAGDAARQKQTHEQTIDALARETRAGIELVRELYEAEHARLVSTARVKTFVSLIATRLVRTALTQSSHSTVQ
jgi:hypothetical protein